MKTQRNNIPVNSNNQKNQKRNNRATRLWLCLLFFTAAATFSISANAQHIEKKDLSDESLVKQLPGFKNGYATVNGVKLHYVAGGTGKALVLLPGWPLVVVP